MKIYTLKKEQIIPVDINTAWEYFSNPFNLANITPPQLGLRIINLDRGDAIRIYPGMIIEYVVTPLLGIEQSWITEITHVKEPDFFVDEQRFGPYKFWHHKHYFTITGEIHVKCTDVVHYSIPFDPLSRILNRYIISEKLDSIFRYREKVLTEKFGKI